MTSVASTPSGWHRFRRLLAPAVTAGGALLALAGCADDGTTAAPADDRQDERAGAEVLGADVLQGEATTIDGSAFDLGSLAGTDLVVWFWAPW